MAKSKAFSQYFRIGHVVFWLLLIIFAIYIIISYLFPFFIGFIISLIFLPIVNLVERAFGLKRTVAVFLVILSFIIIFSALLVLLIAEIVVGLNYLARELPQYIEDGFTQIHHWFEQHIFPLYEQIISKLDGGQQSAIQQSLKTFIHETGVQMGSIIQHILNSFTDFLLTLPNTITVLFFALLAAFFITKDWPVMIQWIEMKLPKKIKILTNNITDHFKQALFRYFFAQLILVSMTGCIVFIGLLIIGVDYAITTALLISLIDLLPYLGTGLVFIPWIFYMFLIGNWPQTISFAVLYAVVIIQRQFAEPKVVAKHIGIPPLPLLITLFVCYKVIGVFGLFIGPALLMIIQSIVRAGVIKEITAYIKG